ncbi:PadR family transcriptional regulator [Metabacillus idriensis]|uniref:PadR family transcriptional regulator n=1 Tax=Metabacillus idriensis TaxID=324768 RepID=A0A6I2M362_9BACI|nr:PadR family transcriptional regulator [Metabacillus idriensis]MCM3595460.1 PadR family transcriptional regulator [Metabacillus idriensis]MRX52515.1 PadR family transcriptional regulator [Metabacillus idriensis]OHR68763.1 PadR family transcriptional regulator [Bacillus sp. HMSC76G11]
MREFILGAIKIHILYHAKIEPVYGSFMIEELRSHGYEIGPGTLYPYLHNLEKAGFLTREDKKENGRIRKYYSITKEGEDALEKSKAMLRELAREVLKEEL